MSEENKQLLPSSVVDLLILDTFKRNGADYTAPAEPLPDEEKKMIRNLVADMQRQVESFLNEQKKTEENFKKAKLDPANVEYVNNLRKKEAEKKLQEEKAKEAERRRNDPDERREQSIRELYAPSEGLRSNPKRKEKEAKNEEPKKSRKHRENREHRESRENRENRESRGERS